MSQLLWSLCALGPPPEAEPLFHYLLHEAALLVTRGGWENCIADRQLRQVVLFCHLVGPPVLRTAAGELRHALETNKKMVGSGAACCREDGEQGSEEEGGREAPPMSSHFHLEVLRCLTQTIGAWDPTTEVRPSHRHSTCHVTWPSFFAVLISSVCRLVDSGGRWGVHSGHRAALGQPEVRRQG